MQPPSSPVTIQFSLWLHTIERTARSCACPSNPETHMSIHVKNTYQMAKMEPTNIELNKQFPTLSTSDLYLQNHLKIKRLPIPQCEFSALRSCNQPPPIWCPLQCHFTIKTAQLGSNAEWNLNGVRKTTSLPKNCIKLSNATFWCSKLSSHSTYSERRLYTNSRKRYTRQDWRQGTSDTCAAHHV